MEREPHPTPPTGARSGVGASRIRDFYSLFGWLPKLDRIAIWIFKPRKGPH
jgi:hypothetical protein